MERPGPSFEQLQARSHEISRIVGQRRDLMGRISAGEVTPPSPTDLFRFEKFISLPERLASSVQNLKARRTTIEGQIAQEAEQHARVFDVYKRTEIAVNQGLIPPSALASLLETYPWLRPQTEKPAAAPTPEPTGEGVVDVRPRARRVVFPQNPEFKKQKKETKPRERMEIILAGIPMTLTTVFAEMLQILEKGQATPEKIGRKMYGPKDAFARTRVMVYRTRINKLLLPDGITIANRAEKPTIQEPIYEIRKIPTPEDLAKKPQYTVIEFGSDQIKLSTTQAEILKYFLNADRPVPIGELSLWVLGAINSTNQGKMSDYIRHLNSFLIEYAVKIRNISTDPSRNASYELVRFGVSKHGYGVPTGAGGAPSPKAETERTGKLLSIEEAAYLAKIFEMKAEKINATLAPRGINVDLALMGRLMNKYMDKFPQEKRKSDSEIIKFRKDLIEKLDLIFTSGLENDLLDDADEDMLSFVIFLNDMDLDFLMELMDEAGGLTIQTDRNYVVRYVAPRYSTEDQQDTQGNGSLRPFTGRADSSQESSEILLGSSIRARATKGGEIEPVLPQPTAPKPIEPVYSPARRKKRVPPVPVPAKGEQSNPKSEPNFDPLRRKYPQVFRRDPEATKTIGEIIRHTLERIPEFKGGDGRTVHSARIAQAFNASVGHFADIAVHDGLVSSGSRNGIAVFSLDQVVSIAGLNGRNDLSAKAKKEFIEFVQEMTIRAQDRLAAERAARIATTPAYRPPSRRRR